MAYTKNVTQIYEDLDKSIGGISNNELFLFALLVVRKLQFWVFSS